MIEHIQQLRGESHSDALANAKVPGSAQAATAKPLVSSVSSVSRVLQGPRFLLLSVLRLLRLCSLLRRGAEQDLL